MSRSFKGGDWNEWQRKEVINWRFFLHFRKLVPCPNRLCGRPASGAYRPDECTNLSIMPEREQYCIFSRLEDGACTTTSGSMAFVASPRKSDRYRSLPT